MPKTCYTHLSGEDRETLSLGLAHGHSFRTIATVLGRASSAVSRDHARNAMSGPYRASTAHTCGPLAVAVRPDTPGPGLFARTDYRAPHLRSQLGHATGGLYAIVSSFTRCTWNLKPPRE